MESTQRGQVTSNAAEVYDEFFVPALFAQWPMRLLDVAGTRPGDRMLDVGCGTGVLARAAVDRVGPTGRVVGVDPNEGMLAVARRRSADVAWRQGVAEALPVDDVSCDVVGCQFAAMFFEDRARAFAELARVVAPGGSVVVATWAEVGRSPGYAAVVDLLRDVLDEAAADALRAPFCLGTPALVGDLLTPHFADVDVSVQEGVARFPSVDDWLHTDIRGWTLADRVDDEQYERLLVAARRELLRFADGSGAVAFAAPALVAVARRPLGSTISA